MNKFLIALYYDLDISGVPKEMLVESMDNQAFKYAILDENDNPILATYDIEKYDVNQAFSIEFDYDVNPENILEELHNKEGYVVYDLYPEYQFLSWTDENCILKEVDDNRFVFHRIDLQKFTFDDDIAYYIMSALHLLLYAKYSQCYPEYTFEFTPEFIYDPANNYVEVKADVKIHSKLEEVIRVRKKPNDKPFGGIGIAPFKV